MHLLWQAETVRHHHDDATGRYQLHLRFDPAGRGTRMRWAGEVRPKGVFRLLGPLITWMGRRQERRIWASLKHRLEASAADADRSPRGC